VGQLSGARFAIPEGGLIIGRDPNHADIVVEHSLVSRRHAQILDDDPIGMQPLFYERPKQE
jgi:pSer/pThr/pTyr-binding forkhead associated (FHA) protein